MKTTGKRTAQTVRPKTTRKGKKKTRAGFTIIEVLIVLAIVGLILLIVFLAVPALNRSQRNRSRKAAVAYIQSAMETYYSEHARYPEWSFSSPQDPIDDFVASLSTGPTQGFTVRYSRITGSHEWPYGGAGAPADTTEAMDTISIMHGHQCNRNPSAHPGDYDYPVETSDIGEVNYRGYAVWTLLESGSDPVSFCEDNIH